MTKGYHQLSKEKYLHKPKMVTKEEIDQIYQARLNGVSSYRTNLYPLLTGKNGVQTNKYPIFFVYLPEIIKLESELRENSNKIKELAQTLPGVAKRQFLNQLLALEINYTNRIEGVETDRGEISTIIRENEQNIHRPAHRRLQSTIRMYQETQSNHLIKIEKLRDFRMIYDSLLEGEIEKNKLPNGELFRDELPSGEELRIGDAVHTVHIPPQTEEAIFEALTSLIEFMNNDDLPSIYKSLITHFFFENTHPFLDGNGRMGRYLLSTYLSHKYDHFTGFSVATAIHARVQTYYRIFKEADQAENYAELTFFIIQMLKLLVAQQEEIVATLSSDQQKLAQITTAFKQRVNSLDEKYDKDAIYTILFYLGESKLFTENKELGIMDNDIIQLNSKNDNISIRRTKNAIMQLEKMQWIKEINGRPKQHEICDEIFEVNAPED
ncbi:MULTISPECIES: Fic family protein [Lactobacillus]|uniref:Fic family protein n=1 Tax=Lactobacillus xujianguonis TaxID=2495899 RepID=A0A437SSG8_9LACO|nr:MULTISPECIES: Fic family protein [Lactobacillus]RVU69860.1 Fic family protein [Lactobacillus xujianguonis]